MTAACLPYLKQDGGSIDTCAPEPNCTLNKHDATPYCTETCTNTSIDYGGPFALDLTPSKVVAV